MTFYYDNVPEERIFALQSFKIEELCKEQKKFYNRWIKENKCECVKELDDKSVLTCEHIKSARRNKFEKKEKEIWNLSVELIKNSPCSLQISNKWLQSLKR